MEFKARTLMGNISGIFSKVRFPKAHMLNSMYSFMLVHIS